MTLNFPDTPGNGEKYLAENGIEYTYNLANDTWTGALSAQNVPINPSPSDVSVDPPFGNPSGTNPGSGTLADPFIITDSIVPTLNGSTESLQTITITSGKAGDQVVFTNNTTPLDISSKYTQPLGYIDANGKWIGKLVYNDSFGADTTSNTTYTGKLQCGTGTVYFQWNVQQQATPAMFVTAGTALTGTPVSGTDLGATQPTVTGGLSPYTYSYKWQTSDNNIAFTDIPSAITSSYSLTSANVGKYIRCIATVSDSSTIQAVTVSSITATVNVVSIDVSLSTQNPQANQPITATAVVLGGVSPITTAYQWKADGVNIIGATSATYLVEVATDGKRLSCQITTTDGDNTNAVKTSTQTNPVASGDVPEINTVTLAEVTPNSPDRFTDQSFTVAVDMTKDNPKSDYAIRGKVLGDLTVDVETSVITKLEEEAVSGAWTAGTLAEDNGMVSVAYGAGKFVAVSANGNNRLQYSADGVTWTGVDVESLATTAQWSAVAYGNGAFVAVNGNGDNRAITSTDGINWTVIAGISNAPYYTDITYGDNRWVATTNSLNDVVVYSATGDPNGSWSNSNVPSGGTGNNWTSVAYGGGKYVAVSSGTGTGTNRVMYSSDGQNWTSTTSAVQNQWKSITYGDGKFVAVGAAGSPDQVMYSTDGINWTSTASSSPSNWTSVTYGNGEFLAVAQADTIRVMYSTDGISWSSMTAETPDGSWRSVVYGGDRFLAVGSADYTVMWSYTGTGAAGTESVLTLTDTSGLASINQGDVVVQNSGGTPVTTAITNVTNTPINKTQAYVFTGTPSNLADVLANGTLVTTGNTWNSSQNLVLVNNANNTIPDMTSVFSANGDTSFYLGLGASYGVTGNDADGGSFKADGTRLGGSGGYGSSEWTLMKYTDIANDGNYNSSYRIYDDAEVAYTVIGFYTANSNTTFGTIADVGTADRPTLTLTDDTNLANFRVGDVVDTQSAAGKLISYVPGSPDYVYDSTAGQAFIRSSPNVAGTFTDTFIADGPGVLILNMYAQGDDIPITLTTNNCTSSEPNNFTISGGTTVLANFTFAGAGSFTVTAPSYAAAGYVMYYLDYGTGNESFWTPSGGSQVTLSSTYFGIGTAVSVTAINEATPSITTNGGSWSGTDGTGDAAWNQSQIWSSTVAVSGAWRTPVVGNIQNVFNGSSIGPGYTYAGVNTGDSQNAPATLTFSNVTNVTKVEIYGSADGAQTGQFNNDTVVTLDVDGTSTIYEGASTTLNTLKFTSGNSDGATVYAVLVNGEMLVDTGITSGTPQTFVTGPAFPAASGTVKTSGSREVTAAIQTSTITNVGEVSPTITNTSQIASAISGILVQTGGSTIYNGAKTPAGLLGLNDYPDLWTPVNPNPNKNGSNETAAIEMVAAEPLSITCIGSAPFKLLTVSNLAGGGSYTYTITGDVTVTGTTGGSQGRYKALSDEVTITPNTSGATFTFTANNGMYINYVPLGGNTVLTLTDTTDLALFTPGDVVQGGGTLNTTVTATAWQGSQSATTVAQVISVGGNMDTNYSGNYVWSTLVFSPPLQGNEFKFYVEAGCTVRNDSNNQVATTSTTGDLLVPDDGTGLLSSVSFSVNGSQGGVTGPYVDGVLTTNAVEVDTLTATASYGIPVSAKVVSTNLATPSITTDGGNWIGTDGTGDSWNQSQVWSQNNTGFEATIAQASKAFNGSTDDAGYNRAYATAMGTYATVTFASALTVSTSLRVWVGSGSTQPNLLKINGNAISGSFPSVAGGWFTVPGISSLSSISVGRDSDGSYGNYTSLYAVEVDGQMLVNSGVSGAPETKVTGPVKTTEQAGPYLTLSPSSGRWLVTETGYSALLKLNKFAKSSSVQSVASLFTVMDGLGNVTDLTTEDPGYTNMVGDPTYTLTFPSVFPSGETPDVELPPGTKYQVEVKATNDIGVDNAFSNDVMPVAGLLQSSVITALSTSIPLSTGYVTSTDSNSSTTVGSQNNPANVFNADFTNGYAIGLVNNNVNGKEYFVTYGGGLPTNSFPDGEYSFPWQTAGEGGSKMNNFYVQLDSGAQQQVFATGSTTYLTGTFTFTAATPFSTIKFAATADNGSYPNASVVVTTLSVDGVRLTDNSSTTLTTVDTTNYNLFSAGDEVVESSGGTPVTSAITNVSDAQLPAQVFSVCDRSSDTMTPYSGNYGQLFDGTTGTSSADISWSNGSGQVGTATLFDLSSSIPLTSLEFQMTGSAEFGVKITDGVGVVHTITPFSGPGGGAYTSVPVSGISSIKKVQVDGYGNPFGMYSIKLNGSLMVDNVALAYGTLLTFTNDTNIANFRVGDQLNGGSGFNPVIYTGNGGPQNISCGFPADFVWIKSRSDSVSHSLYDIIRGVGNRLKSDSTEGNNFDATGLTAFNNNGFTINGSSGTNESSKDYVAWCWDAGDTTVTNTDGATQSTVRSNGYFSVVQASIGALTTIGHGLTATPDLVIAKCSSATSPWFIQLPGVMGVGKTLAFTASAQISDNFWSSPQTATTLKINANSSVGGTSDWTFYCWAAETGKSSFGLYTGNGGSNTIACGFEPAFIMIKSTSNNEQWEIVDNARNTSNPRNSVLYPNLSAAEVTGSTFDVDFTSTGFTLNNADGGMNYSGYTYIYAAFASGTTVTGINEAANQMTVKGGSFIPLVNSSRQWSDGVSSNNGGFGSSEQPEMGFDGLPDTKCKCQQNNAIITIAFSPAITVNKSLKLRYAGSGYGSGYIQIEANGTEVVDTPASGKAGTIIDIPFTGSLTSISIQEGSQNAGFSQIFVDGDVLMNGPWNTSKNWAASSGLNTSNRGPITLAFNGSIGDSVSEGIIDSDTVVIGTNITINTSLQYWSYNTSGQSTTWRFKRASDGNIAVTTLNTADKNNYDYNTVPLPTESGHGLGVEYSQISAQRSTSSETISAIRLDGQVLVDPTTISVTEVTGPTFPPATGTILSTGTRITDKAIQTSTITNVGTAPWPLWNNTALNWSVTGTKTSYNNGGDVVTSALPTGSLLYTEFTIVGTSVQKQLGVQFTTTPNSAYDNNIVGWYFNGASGSKAVWLAGGDSNSSMGAGMGSLGQALYTKADYDAGVSSGSSYGAGDVLGYAIDPDGNVWVSKNGVYLATAGWYAAGNESPVPGGSGYVSTINSDTRYFGAQYNGGQTFTISATGTYTPLQTSLTLTDTTDLAFFSYGDVVQVDGPPNTSLVYAQANDEDMGSYFNYFYASPEFQTAGWKITDFLDETLIGTSFTFSYFWSNDGVNWTKGGNYDSTSSPGIFPVDDSGYGAFTIYGQSGVGEAKISLTNVRYAGTVGTLPTANPFATVVSVTSTNLSTPSINTSGGDWIGTDGTGNTAWNQSQVWSNALTCSGTGFLASRPATNTFNSVLTNYSASNDDPGTITFTCPLAFPAGSTLEVLAQTTGVSPGGDTVFTVNGGANQTVSPSASQTFTTLTYAAGDEAAFVITCVNASTNKTNFTAIKINGNLLVDTGVSGAPETKVTGPVKTITQSGPYITFSETTGRWLVTQSDYDAAKKLDTKVKAPLVLDASNTAHVALFNALNTKFTAFPTARQTFIDALRTKIIGLTLTTPELEVLCGTAKTLVKRHEITIVGNKFYIDGVLQATLSLKKGTTYIFDQDEATNSGHTLKLYTDANKTTEYTSGVTVIGTPGGATSRTTFVVPSNAPAVLYYQSTAAASMGGQLNIS